LLSAYAKGWRSLQPEPVLAAPGLGWVSSWVLLTAASVPLAWFLSAPLGAALFLLLSLVFKGAFESPSDINISVVRGLGFLLALAVTLAIFQWLLLRRHLPHAGWWMPVTVLGWLAAGILISTTGYLLSSQGMLWQSAPLALFALTGATVGLSQWLFLRRVVPRAGWWLLISLGAFAPFLLAGRSFESLLEMLFFMLLPGIISGMGLWLLLHQGPQSGMGQIQPRRRPARRAFSKRLLGLGFGLLLLIPLCAIAPLAYTKSQLELAKREGIYATPEEAVIGRISQGLGEAKVVKIEGLRASPNWPDGRLPHVWFGGARVWLDRVPAGHRRDNFSAGSFYIRVEEGWVHVPEGAFPGFIGRMMEVYGLEGAGKNGPGS
jgi:hypothetical protein